ncbi:GDSL-type esterase/lipase family protein, partial [Nocardioides hankookensis]
PTATPTATPTETPSETPTETPTETATPVPSLLPGYGAIGDSITFGTGSSDPATKSWPALLGIPSVGRPGGALRMWGWHPPLLLTFGADLQTLMDQGVRTVIVEIGTNDLHWIARDDLIASYEILREIATAVGVRLVFTTIPPRPEDVTESGGSALEVAAEINSWLRIQPDVIDLDPCLGDGEELPGLRDGYHDAGDPLHPNDAGYQAFADCVLDQEADGQPSNSG